MTNDCSIHWATSALLRPLSSDSNPANTRYRINAGLMSAHRLRRCSNINAALIQRCAFAGYGSLARWRLEFVDILTGRTEVTLLSGAPLKNCKHLTLSRLSANTVRYGKAGFTLGQRLWRWPNVKPTLPECTVFAELSSCYKLHPLSGNMTCVYNLIAGAEI